MPTSQIPSIPQSAEGKILVNHINDRLRRISQSLGPGTQGPPGKPGTPGTSGGGSIGPATINGVAI